MFIYFYLFLLVLSGLLLEWYFSNNFLFDICLLYDFFKGLVFIVFF